MIAPSLFRELLAKATAGDAWHGPSALSLVEGLTPAEAAARPLADAHSIWEIVLHMTSWVREVERRLGGAEPAPPAEGDWPEVGEPTAEAWERAKRELADVGERLGARVAAFDSAAWGGEVGASREPALGTGVSYAEMAAGVLEHTVYHAGQIALLRKAAKTGEERPLWLSPFARRFTFAGATWTSTPTCETPPTSTRRPTCG